MLREQVVESLQVCSIDICIACVMLDWWLADLSTDAG